MMGSRMHTPGIRPLDEAAESDEESILE